MKSSVSYPKRDACQRRPEIESSDGTDSLRIPALRESIFEVSHIETYDDVVAVTFENSDFVGPFSSEVSMFETSDCYCE